MSNLWVIGGLYLLLAIILNIIKRRVTKMISVRKLDLLLDIMFIFLLMAFVVSGLYLLYYFSLQNKLILDFLGIFVYVMGWTIFLWPYLEKN